VAGHADCQYLVVSCLFSNSVLPERHTFWSHKFTVHPPARCRLVIDSSGGPRRRCEAASVAFDAARNRFTIVIGNARTVLIARRQLTAQVNQARKKLAALHWSAIVKVTGCSCLVTLESQALDV
jgi:hypothetical protein